MGFAPNVDAVRYLVSNILPRILETVPSVHLYIVGKDPHPDIMAASGERITVTGFVQDIRPWLIKARVFVCPLQKGAGIKNKILQAWAMGIPVVATTKSVGGLRILDGYNILVRDRPDAFAEAVVSLLHHPRLARSIGMAGRYTVEQHYSWTQAAVHFGDILQHATTSNAISAFARVAGSRRSP